MEFGFLLSTSFQNMPVDTPCATLTIQSIDTVVVGNKIVMVIVVVVQVVLVGKATMYLTGCPKNTYPRSQVKVATWPGCPRSPWWCLMI